MTAAALPFAEYAAPALPPVTPAGPITTTVGSASNFQFNAAGDKISIIFQALSTTVPDLISFLVPTVTTAGTAGDIEATLETVGNDGFASGTPVTNSATGTATISTTGLKTIAGMDGTATVVVGTLYAIVLTAGAGWDRDLLIRRATGTGSILGLPYTATKDSAGAWTQVGTTSTGFNFGIADAAGSYLYIPLLCGAANPVALASFSDATNPDERGNRFSYAVPRTLIGALVGINTGSAVAADDDFTVTAFTSHTGTPSADATKALLGEQQCIGFSHTVIFDTPVDIAANTVFALAVKATDAGSVSMCRWDFAANAELGSVAGIGCYSTTRNGGAGGFTDDDTKVYSIFPIFSKADDGAGGAGSGIAKLVGMGGGLVG